ncbi:MAG: preprotein translocase subunit SecG [Armatimonadota bacterium]
MRTVLIDILMGAQMLSAVVLIALVISQTTKSEGLTGTIGGKMSSSFRGKPGMDEKLADLTKWSAIVFFVGSLLVFIVRSKFGT